MARKKKTLPFHIEHNLKQYMLKDGTKYWAKDDEDALLYRTLVLKLKGSEVAGIFTNGMLFKEVGVDIPGFEGTMDELDNLVNVEAK